MSGPVAAIPPEPARSFRRIAEDQGAATGEDVDTRHLTRQSLAAVRFVEAVGDTVRYDHARKGWFLWDAHRWRLDRTAAIRRRWLDVLGERYREAVGFADGETRERTIGAIQSAGATDNAIEAGLRIAASSARVAMAGDEWDADPWLLGCENGIVELRTGSLRAGRPEDLVTRSTGQAFDPRAAAERWTRFLDEVFSGDAELIGWFRRLVGASLVGISKEFLALHHGSGNNGKSVAFRTLGHVAGDYGVEIGIETLVRARREAGAPTSDLMRLRGARLAFTSEPDQAAKLAGGTLKRLATIDRMSGRELQGRQLEWDPTHTLHMATNHLPEADDISEGFWRRIALIPWRVRFAKAGETDGLPAEDPGLSDTLGAEAPGILAWAVAGAREYAEHGLHPLPGAVARETATYRADEDPLRGFLEECVEASDEDRAVTSSVLHAAYAGWADHAGIARSQRLNSRRFGRLFAERHTMLPWPVERTSVAGRTAYRGLRLRYVGGTDGDGGLHPPIPGSPYTRADRGKNGDRPKEPPIPPTPAIDVDVAERATDDDGEAER